MFQLGTFKTDTPIFLAPMAGFTNAAMRRVCHRFGAALTYTEMVNAVGLLRASDKTWHLLETLPNEGPVVAHLYGSDPSALAEATARVAALGRFVAIDLNAGCPMRKITTNGSGAALMKQPDLIGRIVAAMHAATPLPITVKTRLGLQPDKVIVLDILQAVEGAGGAALTVHGRFASQEHRGEVHLGLLAEVKRASRIPVIGNGGLRTAADAAQMFRKTGVDAVMIAQGAIGNPWIFQEISESIAALTPTPPISYFRKYETTAASLALSTAPSPDTPVSYFRKYGSGAEESCARLRPRRELHEIRAVLDDHLASELEWQHQIRTHYRTTPRTLPPEQAAVTTFRCHLFRYLHGLRGSAYVRGHLNTMRSIADIRAALDGCFESEALARTHVSQA